MNGVDAGGVTFNLTNGAPCYAEDLPCITAQGTSVNPITFKKAGAGANAVVSATGTVSLGEAGVCILGGDFITFDGINVTSVGATVEYGYRIVNENATNGANNNTVKNSSITLDRSNINSRGVLQSTAAGANGGTQAPTAQSGANSNNTYYNLNVQNVYAGIYLLGTAAFPDMNCEVGTLGSGSTIIGAASANDIGNGICQSWGIRAGNQSGVRIFNTEVKM